MRLVGPATVVSVAYIDPGNWGSNIAAGSHFGFSLLWVVWLSGFLAVYFQYLAGLVGLSGAGLLDLFEARLKRFKPLLAPPLVAMVLATDMAEYMGLIIAVHLLTGAPLDVAAVFALVDVVLLASLSDRRALFARVIGGFVAVVALSFLVELWLVKPPLWEVALGSVVPRLPEGAAVVAVAIMGATIMPHALLLHSHLTHGMDRRVHMWQTLANLLGASAINVSMQIMAATALFGRAVDLGEAPAVLEPLFGGLAAFLFSVALFAASLSASAVSVEAGVLVFRYATGRRFSAAAARLTARLVNIAPALAALHLGASPVEVLVYTQYVLSLVLPVVMAAAVRWSWRMLGAAGRAAALAGTVFVTAMDLYSFVAG